MKISGMRWKRTAALILAAGILVTAGCSRERKEASLTMSGNKSETASAEVIEDILADYMEEHSDTSVSYEEQENYDYYDMWQNREEEGQLDDIILTDRDTARKLTRSGGLEDMAGLVRDLPFPQNMKEQMKSRGRKVCRIPLTLSSFGMYCNLKILEEHGQKVPGTLEEWVDICEYFKTCGITPVIANNDTSITTMVLAKSLYPLYKSGVMEGKLKRIEDGEKELSDYLLRGFTLARDFCTRGYIDRKKALETEPLSDDLEEFVKGESPFMLTGTEAVEKVKSMNPGFEFKVVPYPVLEEGSVLIVNPGDWLSIPAEGKNTERAKEVVQYILKEENMKKLADVRGSFSPLADQQQPEMEEIRDIVESYETEVVVIAEDINAVFPMWDITGEAVGRLLEDEDLDLLMEWMNEQAREAVN